MCIRDRALGGGGAFPTPAPRWVKREGRGEARVEDEDEWACDHWHGRAELTGTRAGLGGG
eukprot:2473390-Rhodomonas_salina.2